jgi:outer membrane cobalamin receptor
MKRFFVSAAFILLCGATGPAAQDYAVQADTAAKGSPPVQQVRDYEHTPVRLADSIVVTANRFHLASKRSIWPVEVVRLASVQGEGDLEGTLDGQNGIDIRNYNGLGSLATLSNWGLFNRHMLLLYNGRVVKDYSLGGFNLSDYSAEEFDRVEILKGPQSAFYGSDAVGGIVNLISPTSLMDRVDVTAKYGSFGLRRYLVNLSRHLGRFGLGASAGFSQTDNSRDNAGSERWTLNVRSDYLSEDNRHHASLSARYFDDSLGVPGPQPDPLYVPAYGSGESSSLYDHQMDGNYSLDMQYRYSDPSVGEAQLDVFWEKKNLDYHSLYNYFSTTDSTVDSLDVYSHSIYNKRSSGVNARYMKQLEPLVMAAGVDWLSGSMRATGSDRTNGVNTVGPFAPYEYGWDSYGFWSASQQQFDVWGTANYYATSTYELDISGRLQFVKNRQAQPSYNLGLVLGPTDFLRLKIAYGYAFRLPTIAEQFADEVYTAGNTELAPETSRSLIATLSASSSDDRVSARVTFFHQTVDSLIQYFYDPAVFRHVPQNVERFKSRGLDLSFRYGIAEGLTAAWSGVYQKAQQSTNSGGDFTNAYYVPSFKWRTDLDISRRIFDLNLNVVYTSNRDMTLFDGSAKTISRVYEFGFSARAALSRTISVALTGYDLTDRRRPDQFGFMQSDLDYPSPGRRLVLSTVFALK